MAQAIKKAELKYSGAKTISPIKGAIVKKKNLVTIQTQFMASRFSMRAFVLGSKTLNAQVKNVLDGRLFLQNQYLFWIMLLS